MKNPLISLVVPFYNEEINLKSTLETLFSYLNKYFKNYELVFVNDGSTDKSLKILKKEILKYPKVKLISYHKNQGRGYALSLGFKKAKGSTIGYIDSDLEISERYIKNCIKRLRTHDMVIVSKHLPKSKIRTTILRKTASKFYNILVRAILGTNVSDHQGGLKFFRKDALKRILVKTQNKKWLFDTELIYFAKLNGFKIAEVPISISYGYGRIQGSMVSEFIKSIFFVLNLRIKNGPLKEKS